ncbi:LIM domain-containing protein [Ditylenchus destructor]|nr:LIM domain-containing protein [Ditylenchus destructor]
MPCAGCTQPIKDQFCLSAIGRIWHDDCLRCICCNCRLAELGWTFYYKKSMLLCWRDYVRLFGVEGQCSLCNNAIGTEEWVMRAATNIYHLQCFACQECSGRFCIGEEFHLYNGRIICNDDYNSLKRT